MQVIPWSAKLKHADGYDHGFLFQGDLDWLLRTYCLVVREKWPNAIIESVDDDRNTVKEYPPPRMPKYFHREGTVFIYRDQQMVAFADQHGRTSDPAGECYLMLLIWPNEAGAHLDLVTAEPFSHPFTSWAVGTLVELIGWWYHIRYTKRNEPYAMPPGHGVIRGGALQFIGVGGTFQDSAPGLPEEPAEQQGDDADRTHG